MFVCAWHDKHVKQLQQMWLYWGYEKCIWNVQQSFACVKRWRLQTCQVAVFGAENSISLSNRGLFTHIRAFVNSFACICTDGVGWPDVRKLWQLVNWGQIRIRWQKNGECLNIERKQEKYLHCQIMSKEYFERWWPKECRRSVKVQLLYLQRIWLSDPNQYFHVQEWQDSKGND